MRCNSLERSQDIITNINLGLQGKYFQSCSCQPLKYYDFWGTFFSDKIPSDDLYNAMGNQSG